MRQEPPPPLPYKWTPHGTTPVPLPEPGTLLPWRHMVWRVMEVNPVPESNWRDSERDSIANAWEGEQLLYPHHVIIRPVGIQGDDPCDRDYDVHLRAGPRTRPFDVYPDGHYPVCVECREPLPCRTQMAEREAGKAAVDLECYVTPSVCPACLKKVTARHKSVTFEENIRVPGGPPVTFHLRHPCRYHAERYEDEWVRADPDARPRALTLTCPGQIRAHTDGQQECSESVACPGPGVSHTFFTKCQPGYQCEACRQKADEQRLALRQFAIERFHEMKRRERESSSTTT